MDSKVVSADEDMSQSDTVIKLFNAPDKVNIFSEVGNI